MISLAGGPASQAGWRLALGPGGLMLRKQLEMNSRSSKEVEMIACDEKVGDTGLDPVSWLLKARAG